jgi:hypothetical protein
LTGYSSGLGIVPSNSFAFRICGIDKRIYRIYGICEPRGSVNFPPGSNPSQGASHLHFPQCSSDLLMWRLIWPRTTRSHNGWRLDSMRPASVQCRAMILRARTTLGDLHRATPWVWLNCEKCSHHAPLACAVPVIRRGANTIERQLPAVRPRHRVRTQGRDDSAPRWAAPTSVSYHSRANRPRSWSANPPDNPVRFPGIWRVAQSP